ncbi:MAG: hypothetical protein KQI35_17945 [Bacteroidetes bacterium]|nr:hypothetical protein [Bacteroidota bacterium]
MKLRAQLISILPIIMIIMASCEGETTYTKKIVNHSSDTLFFRIYSNYPGLIADSVYLLPQAEVIFTMWTKLGGTNSDIKCSEGIDSIHFSSESGKQLLRDFKDQNNWNYTRKSNKRGSVVDNYCEFIIRPEDLSD